MEPASGIEVRGLRKSFGGVVALDGLDLDVARGEIVSLLGPNGAGKSTLLRILGTTVLPDAGTARVCGVDVIANPRAACGKLGAMIGDERSFYWRVSGWRNLVFFAALQGIRRRDAEARAATLLEAVGLREAGRRAVRGYSSGMRARLSLARALLADPPLLLFDEPTRGLDPQAAAGFREVAVELARREGAGILMATHDLHEAVAISDRVIALSGGRIVLAEQASRFDASTLEAAFLGALKGHTEATEPIALPG